MLTKPVAVVLLLAAVVIAAFVGGYVYQHFGTSTAPEDGLALDNAETVSPAGSAAAGSGAAGRARPGGGAARPRGAGASTPDRGGAAGAAAGSGASASGTGSSASSAATDPARPATARVSEDLVVPAGQIVTIQLVAPLSSETAKVEDPAEALIAEDVKVGQIIAVPAGTKVLGSVTIAEKGGKVKEAAKLGVRFHTLVLASGAEVLLTIDPLVQEGVAPSGRSKATIGGGAAVGALTGWLLGGTEGAIKGGVTGAGGGTAATMMTKAKPAVVPKGAQARVRLIAPITVRVERE